jgi:hypothetical protein
MSRNPSETGVTGNLDALTTGGNESFLARRLRTEAQLRALADAGIRTQSLRRELGEKPKPR